MTEYASRHGWSVDVLMIDPSQCGVRDDSRLTSLAPGIRLFGVHFYSYRESRMETALRKWASRLLAPLRQRESAGRRTPVAPPIRPAAAGPETSANGKARRPNVGRMILTVRRGQLARRVYAEWEDWAQRAAGMGIALAAEHPYDVIVSSGPPHMAHEAAHQVADALNLPLVLDFRDPWALESYQEPDVASTAWLRLSRYYEAKSVARASLVVMNTALAEQMMRERYPKSAGHIITAMNGADPELRQPGEWGSTFVISYAGQIYGGRDPSALFRGVRKAIDQLRIAPGQLEVHFMSSDHVGNTPLADVAAGAGLSDHFVSEPMQVRSAALALLRRSAMVVILPQAYRHSIPGKVFEYAQAHAWVLSLAERDSATERLMRETHADVVAPDDADGIARVVAQRFQEFRSGVRPEPLNADGRFDRERQAEKLFGAIEGAIERHRTLRRPRRFSSVIERLG